jgi:peptidoglycan/LPS O-acetylase OafA/YrhL
MGIFLELVTRKFELPSLLLVSNYTDPATIRGYTFYFIEFYVQILVIAALLFSVPAVRRAFAARPMLSSVVFFFAAAGIDYLIELKWNGDYNFDRTPWHYGWCFALGMVIAAAKDLPSRLFALALAVGSVLAVWQITSAALYVAGGVGVVLFVRSITVPAPAKVVIAEIAGASMFIYLTHYQMISAVKKVFGHEMPWLALILSIITGIIGAHVYAWAERFVAKPRRATVPAE